MCVKDPKKFEGSNLQQRIWVHQALLTHMSSVYVSYGQRMGEPEEPYRCWDMDVEVLLRVQ
jgi:hypothetical protein